MNRNAWMRGEIASWRGGGGNAGGCTATYRIPGDKAVMTGVQTDGRDILELAREKGCVAEE